MQVWIAIQACILVLNLGLEYYRGWRGIIVYPEQFVPRHQRVDELGIVHQGDEPYAGEAWLGGPVVLSWADVQGVEYPDGVNVVIHEFAHKLDMLNGNANGFPPLHAGMNRKAWADVLKAAYDDFSRRVDRREDTVDRSRTQRRAPASSSPCYPRRSSRFPDVVRDEYPEVYEQLRQFYRQDPAARLDQITPVPHAGESWGEG